MKILRLQNGSNIHTKQAHPDQPPFESVGTVCGFPVLLDPNLPPNAGYMTNSRGVWPVTTQFKLKMPLEPYPWRRTDIRRRKKRLHRKLENRRMALLTQYRRVGAFLSKRLMNNIEKSILFSICGV